LRVEGEYRRNEEVKTADFAAGSVRKMGLTGQAKAAIMKWRF